MELGYEYTAVSGASVSACWCIGHRYEGDLDGYKPPHGDSYVVRVSSGQAHLHIGGPRWLTGIWQSPEGRVFVTDVAGSVSTLDDEVTRKWTVRRLDAGLAGIYGVAEDEVWTWGLRGTDCVTFRWDGARWHEHACPIHVTRLSAAHGTLVAVGYGGGIARWEGGCWIAMESPTRAGLVDVCVVSADEVYALSAKDELLEGSVHGFDVHSVAEYRVNAVGYFRDELVVGGLRPLGLMRMIDGALVSVQTGLSVTSMDTRWDLLVCTPSGIHSSADLETWTGFGLDLLETLTGAKPVEWRTE